mmetsp:Transcript_93856/g.236480  ORF Transcript_93856/g.236480 Transcript_93856/m.236480 type:complete len:367 (+) Transcript_93856:65-1165(+)
MFASRRGLRSSALAMCVMVCLALSSSALAEPPPGESQAATEEEEVHQRFGELQADEEAACLADGSGSEQCALSLRQLRARGVDGATAATAAAASDAPVPSSGTGAEVTPSSLAPALLPEPAWKSAPSPAARSAAADPTDGVPGGWGEASDFANEVSAAERQNATLKAQWSDFDDDGYDDWGNSGSCAAYGCINYYAPWHACQCNPHCAKYKSCCNDYSYRCSHGAHAPAPVPSRRRRYQSSPSPSHGSKVMTLYHQTSQHAANLIKANGFKAGKSGWCGGAIYFATSKSATETKAIGPDSHKGAMLQCQVNVGRVMYLDKRCGGHAHNQAELDRKGYDSISFNPGDGDEYIIFDKSKVLSIKQIPM